MNRNIYLLGVLALSLLAGGYRLYAANRLNIDFDEPTYLRVGLEYANDLRENDYRALISSQTTYEHPALYKILYGVALLSQKPLEKLYISDLPRNGSILRSNAATWAITARSLSVLFGTLAVGVLALANPLAGLFLGIETLSVKYTSEIYLEALPLLTSLTCTLAYQRWFKAFRENPVARPSIPWLLVSAVFLGLTAASKYVYCLAAVGIAVHFIIALFQKQIPWRMAAWLAGWGISAIVIFFIFNPSLWPDPWNRLAHSISYHVDLQDRQYVGSLLPGKNGFTFWQPLLWLLSPASYYDLGPQTVFKINIDILIGVLAIIGLPRFFQKQRPFFYWFIIGLAFLLLWGNKWPQYTLVLLAPFSLAASEGVGTIWELAKRFLPYRTQNT